MRNSGIGGQAVLEGVMMRNGDVYAVAVRKPDGEIAVNVTEKKEPEIIVTMKKIPIVRGVVNFISSLVIGMKTLTESASYFEEEDAGAEEPSDQPMSAKEQKKAAKEQKRREKQAAKSEAQKKREESLVMGGTVVVSIVLAVAIFMVLPYGLSLLFGKFISSVTVLALIEGVIRMVIFLAYVALISLMEDIRRVYMYHGAEHKCINCIEHGLELTVENVKKSTRFHKRCGTSFLLIVMVISIIIFTFIHAPSPILRLVYRLILIPVVAGISYEFIRLAGKGDNKIMDALSKPGLCLQRITTKEPDDAMIEVGIASVEAVFDWREFQGREPKETE